MLNPINFKQWIEDNRHLLKPPVGNKVIWKDGAFICMVVGGPNERTDYHYDEGPEFFYQIEGDMVLKVIEQGVARDINIREGEIFLLPPRVHTHLKDLKIRLAWLLKDKDCRMSRTACYGFANDVGTSCILSSFIWKMLKNSFRQFSGASATTPHSGLVTSAIISIQNPVVPDHKTIKKRPGHLP